MTETARALATLPHKDKISCGSIDVAVKNKIEPIDKQNRLKETAKTIKNVSQHESREKVYTAPRLKQQENKGVSCASLTKLEQTLKPVDSVEGFLIDKTVPLCKENIASRLRKGEIKRKIEDRKKQEDTGVSSNQCPKIKRTLMPASSMEGGSTHESVLLCKENIASRLRKEAIERKIEDRKKQEDTGVSSNQCPKIKRTLMPASSMEGGSTHESVLLCKENIASRLRKEAIERKIEDRKKQEDTGVSSNQCPKIKRTLMPASSMEGGSTHESVLLCKENIASRLRKEAIERKIEDRKKQEDTGVSSNQCPKIKRTLMLSSSMEGGSTHESVLLCKENRASRLRKGEIKRKIEDRKKQEGTGISSNQCPKIKRTLMPSSSMEGGSMHEPVPLCKENVASRLRKEAIERKIEDRKKQEDTGISSNQCPKIKRTLMPSSSMEGGSMHEPVLLYKENRASRLREEEIKKKIEDREAQENKRLSRILQPKLKKNWKPVDLSSKRRFFRNLFILPTILEDEIWSAHSI